MVTTPDRTARVELARAIRADLASRRAPATVALAAPKPEPAPAGEIGYSGVPAWGGKIAGFDLDPVEAWQVPTRWDTIDRMMTDPDIGAVLAALTLPILAAPLDVEPASDDPFAIELADFINAQLGGMSTSLAGHRFEVMRYLAWGARAFEIVMVDDGKGGYSLRKLALRPNKTILSWHVDDHGGPDGLTQQTPSDTKRLTMDRLLMFVHQREGGDITGRSIMRDIYRPWLIIDDLARVGVVAVERHGAGLPVLHYTGTSPTEKDLYERAMMAIRAHTKGYLLLANGVESMADFEIKGVSGTVLDPVPQMAWHQATLYRRMLAQFMLLGSGDVGSFALSADQSGFFLQALRFVTGEVDDIYTRHLVPKLVGYNWANVDSTLLPRVVTGALDRRDVAAWFTNVVAGINAGIVKPTPELQREAHDILGVPLAEAEPVAPTGDVDVNDPNAEEVTQARRAITITGRAQLAKPPRPDRLESEVKLEALGIRVDFAAMTSRLDAGRDRIIKRIADLQAKQARMLGTAGAKIAKSGDVNKLASALSDPRKLIPIDEEAAAFADELASLYDDGAAGALKEISDQGVKGAGVGADRKGADRDTLAALGYVAAALLADRMATAWAAAVGRQLRAGTSDAVAIAEAAGGAGEKLLGDLANQRANDAFAQGRGAATEANADKVSLVIRTGIIDNAICDYCYSLDGNEYSLDEAPPCPDPDCAGGVDRCRCQNVPVVR